MEKDASKKTAMFARGINNLFIYATCIVSAVGKRLGRGVRSGREAGGGGWGNLFQPHFRSVPGYVQPRK